MKNKLSFVFIFLFIAIIFLGLTIPVYAKSDPQTIPPDQPVVPTATPVVQPTSGANNNTQDNGMKGIGGADCTQPGACVSPSTGTTTTTVITGTITHINIMKYNDNNMANTLIKALLTMSVEGGGGLAYFFQSVYHIVFDWSNGDSLSQIRDQAWTTSASIAALLAGLSLLLIIAVAMTHGAIAVRGYEDVRGVIINWTVSIALAGTSQFWLGKVLTLSDAIGAAIYGSLGASTVADIFTPAHFIGTLFIQNGMSFTIVAAILLLPLGTLAPLLFCVLFLLFLMVMLCVSVILASASRTALVFLAIVLAPIILVLSSFAPLSWLKSTWIKLITFAFLLGPINALLIGLIFKFQTNAVPFAGGFSFSNFFSFIPNTIMMFAMASILITINMGVGKLVYGSAIEVGSSVMGTMGGMLNGAMAIGGFAGGMAALGGGGGGGTSDPDVGSSNTPPSNPSSPNGMGSNASSQNPFSNFGSSGGAGDGMSSAGSGRGGELAGRLGSIMASSGIPGVSGAGQGLRAASAVSDFNNGGGLSALGGNKGGSKQSTSQSSSNSGLGNSTSTSSTPSGTSSTPSMSGDASAASQSTPGGDPGQGIGDYWSTLPGGRGGVQDALFGKDGQPGSILGQDQMRRMGMNGISPSSFQQNVEGSLDNVANVFRQSGFSPTEIGRGMGFSFNNDEKLTQFAMGSVATALTTGGGYGAMPPIFNGEVVPGSNQVGPSPSNVGAAMYMAAETSRQFGNNFSPDTVRDLSNVLNYGEQRGGSTHQQLYTEMLSSSGVTQWMDQKVNELGKDEFFNNPAYGYNGNQVSFDQKYNDANGMWNNQ